MTAQVAADLRAAAEVLRRDGWTQGVLTDAKGHHCASGALLIAQDWGDGIGALARHLGVASVVAWNDAPGRTADEVIAALEAAADAAEAQQ